MSPKLELSDVEILLIEAELHSVMWFSTQTVPWVQYFVQTPVNVIHNYPLSLALEGLLVEESYVAAYNEYKETRSPAELFASGKRRYHPFPMLLEKVYYKKLYMSASATDYLAYKPRTRLIYPVQTAYNAYAPGTTGRFIVVRNLEESPPLSEGLYFRLGAKRFGLWRVRRIHKPAKVEPVKGPVEASTAFNVSDIEPQDVLGYTAVLKHYAGDVAISGRLQKGLGLEYLVGDKPLRLVIPVPKYLSV
ncbi:MAG: hypothetical protein ACP5KA_06815 [Desulfurococcaceae archaeon]